MIFDLKDKELMDGFYRIRIIARDMNPSAAGYRFEHVDNGSSLGFHHGNTRGHRIMDEHRHLEISVSKHLSNVREVHSYLVLSGCIFGIIRGHLNHTAVHQEPEVMRRLLMRKSHRMVSPRVHTRSVRVSHRLGRVLRESPRYES